MKRLALLLAAMGIVSAAAFAEAPVLKVTSIGQEIEIENNSGGVDIGDSVFFGTMVNLSYGDWTYGVTGGKFWSVDTEDGFESINSRLQLDAMKTVNENWQLGARYRAQKDFDRYYARAAWDYGMIYGAADVWYNAANDSSNPNDNIEMELFPIGLKYGNFKAAWFVNYVKFLGSVDREGKEEYTEHQIRLYADLYKGEKLTVNTEYRLTLNADADYREKTPDSESLYKDFGRSRLYLGASYKVNESLNVYGKYGYEIRDKEYINSGKDDKNANYYGDLILGWSYTF
ncbi:hypothetical protein [Fusobacterium sp. SYSU M8D902]|uniref:hypothetical protein n=1 Tax=Fusobacterium sp. SYSU M8D902 TaxID=3159562 RepID=UPI0032E49CF1